MSPVEMAFTVSTTSLQRLRNDSRSLQTTTPAVAYTTPEQAADAVFDIVAAMPVPDYDTLAECGGALSGLAYGVGCVIGPLGRDLTITAQAVRRDALADVVAKLTGSRPPDTMPLDALVQTYNDAIKETTTT